MEIGDLHNFAALEKEEDVKGAELDPARIKPEISFPAEELKLLFRNK